MFLEIGDISQLTLSEAYPEHHLLIIVLDGAPSHRSEEIIRPGNVSFVRLFVPTLPRTRSGGEMVSGVQSGVLSNRTFEAIELLQEEALNQSLLPYMEDPACLQHLTGFPHSLRP
jgi:hypothetical protein